MDKIKYLNRIGIKDANISVNSENLKFLQKQHLLKIPFENLDIHWKRPIMLNTKEFYRKIIGEKRGGFCYELNGLFGDLLNEIGFTSKIISARVANEKDFGAEYDHLAILTKIDEKEFLVDVGFGDFSAEPLKFILNVEQKDVNGTFLIKKFDDDYFEVVKKVNAEWQSEYIFRDSARDLAEFKEMCNFHQTSPESHFTSGKICSLMLENGRKTLTDSKFIETKNDVKNETKINSENEFDEILLHEFSIKKND
jgi:N-hydroxyarylamine O-acetyltransferase